MRVLEKDTDEVGENARTGTSTCRPVLLEVARVLRARSSMVGRVPFVVIPGARYRLITLIEVVESRGSGRTVRRLACAGRDGEAVVTTRGSQPGRGARAVTPAPRRSALRERLDPYGGLTTILVVLFAVVFLGVIAWQSRPRSASTADLKGVEVPLAAASHISNPAELIIPEGQPPAGGPHFAISQQAGAFTEPIQDGNVIHSLEHGMIWISYNKDKVSAADIAKLTSIQKAHSRDVILSPRPEDSRPIAVASWGRLLQLDAVDEQAITDFISTNRDRSPEPGVR